MATPRLDRLDRNLIINGTFEFFQRTAGNTTIVNLTGGANVFGADRMISGINGPTAKNFSLLRSTDVPSFAESGFHFSHSLRFNCLTALTGVTNPQDVVIPFQHRIEGQFFKQVHRKTVTFGSWIKVIAPSATFPITLPINFGNNLNRSYTTTVQVAANNTWQFVKVTLLLDQAGTWLLDNSLGLKITVGGSFVGADFLAPSTNSWLPADYLGFAGTFNLMGAITNSALTTGWQLIEGETMDATTMIRAGRSHSDELLLCERYYEKSYALDVNPGAIVASNLVYATFGDSAGQHFYALIFKSRKRTIPMMTIYNPAGVVGQWQYLIGVSGATGSALVDSISTDVSSQLRGFSYNGNAASRAVFQFTADAEL